MQCTRVLQYVGEGRPYTNQMHYACMAYQVCSFIYCIYDEIVSRLQFKGKCDVPIIFSTHLNLFVLIANGKV